MTTQTRLVRSQLLQLHGPDAAAFAHAQFMNDSRSLADGAGQWSGWLTPKGRVVAFFALIRLGADDFLLWLPDGGGDVLRERLQRFVFRSKVGLTLRHDLHAIARFGAASEESAQALAITSELARFDPEPGNTDNPRCLCITRHEPEQAADAALAARWQLADLVAGIPYITAGSDNSEQFVPQWLSLDRLDAYSVKKGCYPGQEIVARMHFLGQSKRAACRLAGSGEPPPAMASVMADHTHAIGEIVWATRSESGWVALAVLAIEQVDRILTVEGNSRPLHRLPD